MHLRMAMPHDYETPAPVCSDLIVDFDIGTVTRTAFSIDDLQIADPAVGPA